MSYILDALRKAERERRRTGRVPTLETVHQPALGIFRRWWLWAVAAALALNAAVLIVVLRPSPPVAVSRESQAPADLPAIAAVSPAERAGPAGASPRTSAEGGTLSAGPPGRLEAPPARAVRARVPPASSAPTQVGAVAPAAPATVAPPAPPPGPAPEPTGEARPRALPAPVPPPLAPLAPTEAPPPARPAEPPRQPAQAADAEPAVAATRDARGSASPPPLAGGAAGVLRDAMAKMNLDVLVYSEHAAERFVFINSQKYVEGEQVDGRFVVEAITNEGVVLSHAGDRRLLRPKSNPYLRSRP